MSGDQPTLTRLTREDDYEKRWIVVGQLGAVDFHCSTGEFAKKHGVHGGVEYHYRQPANYMGCKGADHPCCWILGGPCWHDGTSLWASEYWIPLLQQCGENAIWAALERTYVGHDWPATKDVTKS